jgi:hypothetical protein
MSCVVGNKIEIRRRALLEAVRFCGGVSTLSHHLKVSRSRASNWVNQPEIEMPYEYALLTEDITQVSIERLSPSTEVVNKMMRRLRSQIRPSLVRKELSEISVGDHPYLNWHKPDRPIIVGTDGVLISGLVQVEMLRASGVKHADVLILDLEAFLLEKRIIQDVNFDFLISESVAIGLRLESLIGNRQGQRNDLKSISTKNETTVLPTLIKIKGRKDIRVAKIIGYSTNSYYRARKIYLHGNLEMITVMDKKEISIAFAASKIEELKVFQPQSIQSKLQGVQP